MALGAHCLGLGIGFQDSRQLHLGVHTLQHGLHRLVVRRDVLGLHGLLRYTYVCGQRLLLPVLARVSLSRAVLHPESTVVALPELAELIGDDGLRRVVAPTWPTLMSRVVDIRNILGASMVQGRYLAGLRSRRSTLRLHHVFARGMR